MEIGGETQGAPPSLDQARSEFNGPIPRLVDHSALEIAAVGVFRRSGVLTAISLNYFDLRWSSTPPEEPGVPVPAWLSDWTARLIHPLLSGVVQVWARDEFGGEPPSAETMMRTVASAKVNPSPVAEAVIVDGSALTGFSGDIGKETLRSAEYEDVYLLVRMPIELSPRTPQLTVY